MFDFPVWLSWFSGSSGHQNCLFLMKRNAEGHANPLARFAADLESLALIAIQMTQALACVGDADADTLVGIPAFRQPRPIVLHAQTELSVWPPGPHFRTALVQ